MRLSKSDSREPGVAGPRTSVGMRIHYLAVRELARLYGVCIDLGYGRRAFEQRWKLWSLTSTPFIAENDRYRMIFIHVPKTGGMTVLASLFGIEEELGHKPAVAYRFRDEARFSAYFKFCVVRNPWDRAVSAFHFLKQGGLDEVDRRWADATIANFPDFPAFARALANRRFAHRILGWKHFQPQAYYIADATGRMLVDYVARQERLDQELSALAERFGVGYEPSRRNASARRSYPSYYDDETRGIIGELYSEDVALLGYTFEEGLPPAAV